MTNLSFNRKEGGAVLPTVLFLLALLASMVIVFSSRIQTMVRTKSNMLEEIRAEALIENSFMSLQSNSERLAPSPTLLKLEFDEGYAEVEISDEEGKIDINASSFELLRIVFQQLGLEPSEEYAAFIIDYRDTDSRPILQKGLSETYTDKIGYDPKNSLFESVDELHQIPFKESGLDYNDIFTVHTRKNSFDATQSSVQILRELSENNVNLSPYFHASSQRVLSAKITAKTNGGTKLRAKKYFSVP